MIKLIVPTDSVKFVEEDSPLIFLAGPINGAPAWHEKAIDLIDKATGSLIYIASPKREKEYNKDYSKILAKTDNIISFEDQLTWERYYLSVAANNGAIMFWLPVAETHDCYRTYARDTRGELGEWRGMMQYSSPNIVIGAEEKFDGLKIIKKNYLAVNPEMKFYSNLEDTVKAAVELADKF